MDSKTFLCLLLGWLVMGCKVQGHLETGLPEDALQSHIRVFCDPAHGHLLYQSRQSGVLVVVPGGCKDDPRS